MTKRERQAAAIVDRLLTYNINGTAKKGAQLGIKNAEGTTCATWCCRAALVEAVDRALRDTK